MSLIPTLQSERLVLRPQTADDWPAYFELMTSERARFMGGPFDQFGSWALFCHDLAQWQLFGHGALMVALKDGGTCVGQVGINHGPLFPEKELGWMVYEPHEGKGYASEAAETLRQWAFETLGLLTLVSYVDKDNGPSIRLAERLGAVLDPAAKRNDPKDLVYRHPRVV
ncbi:GNAT family N-acetyltransferase [Roseibium limicola]|uniref:GNAT family N-acetyltransferase n=1 Tax=Roseibium limicola TaxID=2816037 RepID=A0A939EKD3_9HYPH|nr:GNAT family N-acetyltransferase [Roseibium limicola]MBO0343830.1 GNAT family N-acetyltransferase [Roseibium limicola]